MTLRHSPLSIGRIPWAAFSLESPAMRSLLAKVPVRTQADIAVVLALIRPGAAADRAKSAFTRRARGEEQEFIFEPAVSDRLAATHGIIVFEEDIMILLGTTTRGSTLCAPSRPIWAEEG